MLNVVHDEDAEIHLNGILAATFSGYNTSYQVFPMADTALKALKPGRNTLAIHCHQSIGSQTIDCGIVELLESGN